MADISALLTDYRTACLSRHVSLITRREVMSGNAKFGSYGDGKELAQLFQCSRTSSLFSHHPRL